MRVLIAGCGYVGTALGTALCALGHQVAGIRRPGGDPGPMRAAGIEPLHADLSRRGDLDPLPASWDWVVACAAPSEGGEAAYRSVYLEGLRNLVDWLTPRPPSAFVFTGSTGVYPQTDGSDVDERAPTEGASATGAVLLQAEEVLTAAAARGFPAVILRISGIYGPGRNRIPSMLRGEAGPVGSGERWMNMVHRDDLVAAILAALERGRPGAVYNISDGASCTEAAFYEWLGRRLGRPSLAESPGSGVSPGSPAPGRRGRGQANRRIVAERARRELGWEPGHPDFRSGYEEVIRAMEDVGWLFPGGSSVEGR